MAQNVRPSGFLARGTVVGDRYRVLGVLGRGATAVVYEAEQVHIGQRFALKVLNLAATSALAQQAFNKALLEARLAAQLTSEHAVRVFDVGMTASRQPYVVMEKLEGRDLSQELRAARTLPVPLAVGLTLQACHALAEAHAVGIVHRDLKPSNLFVTRRADGMPHVKVLDFGLAQYVTAHRPPDGALRVSGSPGYASPEQIGGYPDVDARADVWGLGAILYEMVSGRPPFAADSLAQSLLAAVSAQLAPLTTPQGEASPELDAIVRQCLRVDRDGRFQSAVALATALSTIAPPWFVPYGARAREVAAARRSINPDATDQVHALDDRASALPSSGTLAHDRPSLDGDGEGLKSLVVAEVVPAKRSAHGLTVLGAVAVAIGLFAFVSWARPSASPPAVGLTSAAASSPLASSSSVRLLEPLPPAAPVPSSSAAPHASAAASAHAPHAR